MLLKKLIVSLLIIAGVGTTAVASTRALLSDQATLGSNTFSTGTVDLQIAKEQSGGTFEDSVLGFTETILPGETITNYFRLKNNSTDATFSIAAQAATVSGTISPTDLTIKLTPVNSSEEPVGATVTKTLADWVSTPAGLGLPNIGDGDTQEYKMDVVLDEDVTTESASVTFDMIFTGTQVTP